MKDQIIKELNRIELQYNIKVLYAVESGSRAWGFASTDSDWDIRFIYIHHIDWYLQIDTMKDSIEEMLPNDLDFAGWEFKKSLKLFRKSNPPMLEWLTSSLIYLEPTTTANALRILAQEYFNPKSCLHHYLSMANNNNKNYVQKDIVKIKKYLYVLRPILACEWIKIYNTMPPITFIDKVNKLITDHSLKTEINSLLDRKMSGQELNEEPKIKILHEYIDLKLIELNTYVSNINQSQKNPTDKLNHLFKHTLEEAWRNA